MADSKIKLGANAGNAFSIPVSVPVEVKSSRTAFEALDVKHFVTNDPTNGLVVTADQLATMMADTNLPALIAAGLVVVV